MKDELIFAEDLKARLSRLVTAAVLLENANSAINEFSDKLLKIDEKIEKNSVAIRDTKRKVNSLELLFNQQAEKQKTELSNLTDLIAGITQKIDTIGSERTVVPSGFDSEHDAIRLSVKDATESIAENLKMTGELEALLRKTVDQFQTKMSSFENKTSEIESRLNTIPNQEVGHFSIELQQFRNELNQFGTHLNSLSGKNVEKTEFQKLTGDIGAVQEKLSQLSGIPVTVYDLADRVIMLERLNARLENRISNIYMQWFISFIGLILFICALAVMAMR